jgi:hypothetical protein
MRRFATTLLMVGAWGLAGPAGAQSGLQHFESDIKPQLQFKSFTYGGSSALGSAGFVLDKVVAVVPGSGATGDKDTTVKIDKVTVDELDFDRMKAAGASDDLPRFAKLKLEGITGDDEIFVLLTPYGVPKVPLDFALDYRLDPDTKVLTLSKLELNLRGEARLTLALVLDGISDKTSKIEGAKDDARLRNASLDFDDKGLLAKLLPVIAKEQKTTADAMVAMAAVPVGAFAQSQGPEAKKALDAIVSFMSDWKKPDGPIKISIKPAKSAKFDDLEKVAEPNALTDIFGLTVAYAGTRAGAAGGSAGGSQAAAGASGDARKTMTGGEAWLSIVGNTLTGKDDGEVWWEHYRKDGTLTLLEGKDVTNGKWTLEGERVCFKYPDEDKNCYTVSRTGEQVTLVRKGKGERLTLLPGNPKNL